MEYMLLERELVSELEEDIDNFIKEGWELYGSPSSQLTYITEGYDRDNSKSFYCHWIIIQAMIRRKDK